MLTALHAEMHLCCSSGDGAAWYGQPRAYRTAATGPGGWCFASKSAPHEYRYVGIHWLENSAGVTVETLRTRLRVEARVEEERALGFEQKNRVFLSGGRKRERTKLT